MKQKDLILVILAVGIISVAGFLVFTQLMPSSSGKSGKASSGTQVDVIGVMQPDLNQTSLGALQDPAKSRDYTVVIDLSTGLGNTQPFGR